MFNLPEALISESTGVLPGIDGQKMSKSYNNTIPIFLDEKALLKMVRKIKTNSLEPGVPKDPTNCNVFKLFKAFASETETKDCLLYTSPSPRDVEESRMPSSA